VGTPPPDLMTAARRFTIAFAVVALAGLVIGVAIPLVVPGPKLLTIALGSCCFVLVMVVGARLLRRALIPRVPPADPAD
jgi:uncharacterized membrane protein